MSNLLHRLGNGIGIIFFVGLTFLPLQGEGKALPDGGITTQNTEKGSPGTYSAAGTHLLNDATRIEGFTTNFFNPISSEFRISWAGDRSRSRVTEVFLNTRYVQYTHISVNIRVNYRKSDLIFPFHYY